MTLIVGPKALLHTEIAEAIYMDDETGELVLEYPDCVRVVQNPPADALAKIARAEADGDNVIEFEDASLYMEETNEA